MLLYRIEDEDGNGPYYGDWQGVRHPSWYGAPYMDKHGEYRKINNTVGEDCRYTHVFAMDSLDNLMCIFQLSPVIENPSEYTHVWVSVYSVHGNATVEMYSTNRDSKQIHFDRTKATLVERFQVPVDKLRGAYYATCPPHLYLPEK